MAEPSFPVDDVRSRRHAELLADIAASAIPHRGHLTDLLEFAEMRALQRPSVLRRVAADLGAAVPPDTTRLVAAGWPAAVLATAISLHTGLPLTVVTPDDASATGAPSAAAVALVVPSTAADAEVQAHVEALARAGARVNAVLSVLADGPGSTGAPSGTPVSAGADASARPRPVRVSVLGLEELHSARP